MRPKRRYLAVEVIGSTRLDRKTFVSEIVRSHLRFAGEKGFQTSSPWVVSFNEEDQRGIVRTLLAGLDDLRASLAMITTVDGEPVILRTLGVSGTIRACEDKFIRKSTVGVLERTEKRNGEEDPGMSRRMAQIKAIVPGSRIRVSHKTFRLKQVFDDGRIDLTSDEGSFGFTILDLLVSNLGNEGQKCG